MQPLTDFPFESHFLQFSGFRLHYLDEGIKGNPALLFLQGVPTWSYTFRHIIPECVKAGYRVMALDLPGFGLSEKHCQDWRNRYLRFLVTGIPLAGEVKRSSSKEFRVPGIKITGYYMGDILFRRIAPMKSIP